VDAVKSKGPAHYRGGRSNLAPMRKYKNSAFPPAIKIQIRSMFESGMYNSLETLHAECKKIFKDCPTPRALKKWSEDGNWDKFKMKKVMEEVRSTNYKELFAAEGMGDAETVKEVVSGIKLADTTMQHISERLTQCVKESNGAFLPTLETIDLLKGLTRDLYDNFKIKERFLEQRHKLVEAGSYGRQKITITPSTEDPSTMTPEEARRELDRIAKAVAIQG
jgi:hypothetical protein